MEIKKSHKADLERKRPLFFAIGLVVTMALFAIVLFVPFPRLGDLLDEAFDDYSMDLDLSAQEQDDMISAALPEEPAQEEKKDDANKLNKVEEVAELAPPESLDEAKLEEDKADDENIEAQQENDKPAPPINQNEDDEDALRVIEQLPEYPGGMVEFMKWLTATLKYPPAALQNNIQGKVMVSFIVETDGTISNIKLMKGANKLLNDEALRVVGLMPKWTAGKDKGKPCRSMVAIPVIFEI